MNSEAIYQLVQKEKLGGIPPNIVHQMFQSDQSDYDEVVIYLLTDNAEYLREQGNYEYGDVYYCQVAGSVLFAMRPNAELYPYVLNNSIKIGDPSSCRDAVVALLQIKSPPNIAIDLLEMMDNRSLNLSVDEVNSRILNMFYWLGTSPRGLMNNHAWPGYTIGAFYNIWFNKTNLWPGEKDPETGYPLTPPADPLQAEQASILILEKMLDLFEENNANQTARSVIAQLPLPDKEYLAPYRERIIQAFVSATVSADDYVRQRVSNSTHQRFISQA